MQNTPKLDKLLPLNSFVLHRNCRAGHFFGSTETFS